MQKRKLATAARFSAGGILITEKTTTTTTKATTMPPLAPKLQLPVFKAPVPNGVEVARERKAARLKAEKEAAKAKMEKDRLAAQQTAAQKATTGQSGFFGTGKATPMTSVRQPPGPAGAFGAAHGGYSGTSSSGTGTSSSGTTAH